jgi:hypothetical protein
MLRYTTTDEYTIIHIPVSLSIRRGMETKTIAKVGFYCAILTAVLTAFSGYAEYLYWDAEPLIPVPNSLDPAKAIPLILNYIVA